MFPTCAPRYPWWLIVSKLGNKKRWMGTYSIFIQLPGVIFSVTTQPFSPPSMVYFGMQVAGLLRDPPAGDGYWQTEHPKAYVPSCKTWPGKYHVFQEVHGANAWNVCVPQRNTPNLTVDSWIATKVYDFHHQKRWNKNNWCKVLCCSNQLSFPWRFSLYNAVQWLVDFFPVAPKRSPPESLL